MKFLFIFLLVLAGIWLWRTKRPQITRTKKQAGTPTDVLNMVSCAHCSIHVPAEEAVQGKKGAYCSTDHRQRAEA
jgi:uncharacterized protein